MLRENRTPDQLSETPSITLENMLNQGETSVRLNDSEYVSMARMRSTLEKREQEINHRESEVNDREKDLLESLEKIENDIQALEETSSNLEQEEVALSEKERALLERESELERISDSLSEWRDVLSRYEELTQGGQVTPADIDRVIKIQEDFQEMLDRERASLSEQVRGELSDEMETMALREEQFMVAESTLMQKTLELKNALRDRKDSAPVDEKEDEREVDLESLMRDTFKEIETQIGIGLEVPVSEGLIPTHVERLDRMLQGGIPKGHVVLVNGTTGTMKSSLSYHILHHCAVDQGIRGMFFSLDQNRASILRQMKRLGLDREKSRENLMVVDMIDLRKAMAGEEGDWRTILMRYVQNIKRVKKLDLFVLDSLESFKAMSDFAFTREDLAELFEWFRGMGLTTFLISELPFDELVESGQGELYLADGSVGLVMHEVGDKIQRWIRVSKMRGVNVDRRYYSFIYDGGTFHLHTPLASKSD